MGISNWTQVGAAALQMDSAGDVWNSGHVAAALPMSNGAVVTAADTGGPWSIGDAGAGLPSGDWEAPDMTSLARGPDGEDHVFAGGGTGISLSAPEVVLSGPDQLRVFGVGQDHALWHYVRSAGTWSAPESLGPDVVGAPAVCSWSAGRIDVFVVGTDGALYHKWWDGTAWGPSLTLYERLGGVCVGQPSAVAWGPNRLDIFVIGTDGGLYHKWWDGTAWGPSADGFEAMGGSLVESPVAFAKGPNHLDVFCVRSGDRVLLHKRWDGTSWLPSLTGYEALGAVAGMPAATSWGGETLQLCAVQPDGSLGYKSWDSNQWLPSAAGWTSLGAPPSLLITEPSLASWGPNRVDVVCVDATGTLQHKWLDGSTWGPSATGYEAMGEWVAGHANIVAPAANRLDIVINGGDGLVYYKSYDGSGWSPAVDNWTSLPGPIIGVLHETDTTQTLPLLSWREIAIPQEAGRVSVILVLPAHRWILLGCDHGVWWSSIPAASTHGVGYLWSRVQGLPDCAFSGLAATGDSTFVAAAYGSNMDTGAYGIFHGQFMGDGPVMARSTVVGADPRLMARTSLASCDGARSNVYAVGCDVWTDHAYTETPDAVCWGSNRIDLFARGATSDCQHLSWDGRRWTWESLGGILLGTPRVVSWGSGRLDVFGVGTDRAIYHKWWSGSAWGPSATGWEAMGGVVVADPAVCSWSANRLDLFVVGTDGTLYHKWWDGSAWSPSVTGYENLGGTLWGTPVAVCPGPNRIDVYGCGTDGTLYLRRWDGSTWLAWQRLGDLQVLYPTAVVGSGGVVDVFGVGDSGNVLHKRWNGTIWLPSATTYDDLGGAIWNGPTAVVDGATVEVWVRGTDNLVYVNAWNGRAWGGWNQHGGNALGSPAVAIESGPKVVSWGPGRRDVFVKAPNADPNVGARVVWQLWSNGGATFTWAGQSGSLRPACAPYSIYTFLRSADGGTSFQPTAMYLPADPNHYMLDIAAGNQGWYNNCLAVKPNDARTVAVGWRGGPFLSTDAGETWKRIDDGDTVHNCHGDVHAVAFDATGLRLFSGSDGGLAATTDQGASWKSQYNRNVHTLQVYGGGIVAFSASYQVDGLVVAGLQDNGDVSCRASTGGEPWRQFLASDGGITLCLRTGQILYTNNMNPKLSVFRYGGSGAPVPLTVPKPGGSADPSGLAVSPHIVNSPAYTNRAGEKMMAIGAASTSTDLYGAFAKDDGSDLHWEYIGSIAVSDSAVITCANSGDGRLIFVGFDDGRIAAFDPATGATSFHTIHPGKDGPGTVVRILMHDTTYAYALANRGPNGVVLRYQGAAWERVARGLPLEPFSGITTDWTVNPKTMFVSTDSRVYLSTDGGDSWQIATQGLPRRAHLNELDFAEESNGTRYVYVATWGRSAFRAKVT